MGLLRFSGTVAAVALVLAACGETLSSPNDNPNDDAGADASAIDSTATTDGTTDGQPTLDAPASVDAGCDGLALDYAFTTAPIGFNTVLDDGGSIQTTDGSLVSNSMSGARALIRQSFDFAPSSVQLAYTIREVATDSYTELGCYLTLVDPAGGFTSLLTYATGVELGFDDSVRLPDAAYAESTAARGLIPLDGAPHRLVIDMPEARIGKVPVTLTVDGTSVTYIATLESLPTKIDLTCGIEFQGAPSPKRLVVDDVSVRACPR